MKKIYFAPNKKYSSDQFNEDFKLQSPNNSGSWKNICSTTNIEEAEFLIIQDYTDDEIIKRFEKKKIIYFSREALTKEYFNYYYKKGFNNFSFWDESGYLFSKWVYAKPKLNLYNILKNIILKRELYSGLGKSYDELSKINKYEKNKFLCSILSYKNFNEGHRKRLTFTKNLLKKLNFDLYGSVNFKNSDIGNYKNDIYKLLIEYKYRLGFDNQYNIEKFFGTQFVDSILTLTVPIFSCGTDLSKFFPKKSFIQFDVNMSEIEMNKFINVLKEDDYSERLDDLKEAKELILKKYNFWPTVEKIINN